MKTTFFLKLLVSVAFFLLLAKVVQGEAFLGLLRQVDPVYVVGSFAISFVMIGVSCWKWQILLRHQGHPVGYLRLYRYYLVGYFYTSLLPSNVGGDVARSLLAGREVGSQSDAAVSVFLERFTGVLLLLALVVLAPVVRPGLYREPGIWIPALGAVGILVTLLWIIRADDPFGWLARLLGRDHGGDGSGGGWLGAFRRKGLKLHDKLSDSLRRLGRSPDTVGKVVLSTVIFYGLTWINVWITFKAFGVHLDLRDVIAPVPAVMLVQMIPVAPMGSLGLAEGAYVFYFSLLAVDSAASLAMGLLLRVKLVLLGLLGWLCYLGLGVDAPIKAKRDNAGIE